MENEIMLESIKKSWMDREKEENGGNRVGEPTNTFYDLVAELMKLVLTVSTFAAADTFAHQSNTSNQPNEPDPTEENPSGNSGSADASFSSSARATTQSDDPMLDADMEPPLPANEPLPTSTPMPPPPYLRPQDPSISIPVPQCPSQPDHSVDPRSIPIADRNWYKGGAHDFIKHGGRTNGFVVVDMRSHTITADARSIPQGFVKTFTQLGGRFTGLFFSGRPTPIYDFPRPVPPTSAKTFRERVLELQAARKAAYDLYLTVSSMLSAEQQRQCLKAQVTLYKRENPDSDKLIPVRMDKAYFWQRMHPVWNPFVKPYEASYLQAAVYVFYSILKFGVAHEIEDLLRTPHYDDWEIRELVGLGALDDENREDEALAYFRDLDDEHWNFHAEEAEVRQSANELLETMEQDRTA